MHRVCIDRDQEQTVECVDVPDNLVLNTGHWDQMPWVNKVFRAGLPSPVPGYLLSCMFSLQS